MAAAALQPVAGLNLGRASAAVRTNPESADTKLIGNVIFMRLPDAGHWGGTASRLDTVSVRFKKQLERYTQQRGHGGCTAWPLAPRAALGQRVKGRRKNSGEC